MKVTAPLREFDEALDIRVYEVRYEDEPALWFQRDKWGRKLSYLLPLSRAYLVNDERDLLARALIMARELNIHLTGKDDSTISDLMDLLTKHIDDLVSKIPPAPEKTRLDLENELSQSGIQSMKIDGQELLH